MKLASPLLITVLGASIVSATQVLSQQSASAASADPLARFFTGSRSCSGKSQDRDMKSFHATTGKYTAEKVLDGHWVVIRYDEDKSAKSKEPFRVVQYFGYDMAKKNYVAIGLYNAAGVYSIGTSAGWKGGSITFDEGDTGKGPVFRDTFTTSHGAFTRHTGMMRDQDGQWVETDEETCTKPA